MYNKDLKYDDTDPIDIYNFSKNLLGKQFIDIITDKDTNSSLTQETDILEYANIMRKGGLGEFVEEYFFGYRANNDDGPDFPKAGLELKVTPFKKNKNGTYSSKERLILTMIDYFSIIDEDFYESRVWNKSKLMLIIFYLWSKEAISRLNYEIKYSFLYSPPEEDLKIIMDDYYTIKRKVEEGRAHELSEGDTMYLGAAVKASTSKDRRKQPNSQELAKPRAFSLKNSYMTTILNEYVIPGKKIYHSEKEKILKEDTEKTFEQYVLDKINKHKDIKATDLFKKYLNIDSKEQIDKNKGIYSDLAFRLLGIKSNQAEEFLKAGIVVKTMRIEENDKIIESMSFPTFEIMDFVNNKVEDSYIYNYFEETKFLFVKYKKYEKNGDYFFKGASFWNMPSTVIENELKEDLEKIQDEFKKGVKFKAIKNKNGNYKVENSLPKKKDLNILQIRSHAQKGYHLIDGKIYGVGKEQRDSDLLPDGNRMTKQCFWLQNTYVEKVINIDLDPRAD